MLNKFLKNSFTNHNQMPKETKSHTKLIKKHPLFFFSKVKNMPLTAETKTCIENEKAEQALKAQLKSPFADELRNYLTDESIQ